MKFEAVPFFGFDVFKCADLEPGSGVVVSGNRDKLDRVTRVRCLLDR